MPDRRWRGVVGGFAIAGFVLLTFILREGEYQVAQAFELLLTRGGEPAPAVEVRIWNEPGHSRFPCQDEPPRESRLETGTQSDAYGVVELERAVNRGIPASSRQGRDTYRRVQVCVRESTAEAWRPIWSASAESVDRRVLNVACDLGAAGVAASCRSTVSTDLDQDLRDYWLPILLMVGFVGLAMALPREGFERPAIWFLLGALLLRGSVMTAEDLILGNILLAAALLAALVAWRFLWRLGWTDGRRVERWKARVRTFGNPFRR
jgi:hypothetical protein